MSEKTEPPTDKKIRDSRKKGQVANSKELVSAFMLTVILMYFWVTSDFLLTHFTKLISLPADFYELPFRDALPGVFKALFKHVFLILLPVIGLTLIGGIFINFVQVGPLLAFQGLKPDLKKLNPAQGMKKIFAMKNLVEFIKSSVKICFLGTLMFLLVKNAIADLVIAPAFGIGSIIDIGADQFKKVIIYTLLAFALVAAFDVFYQRMRYTKDLMMSKDEIKREYKEQEGDPLIKSKRKQFHREMIEGGVEKKVASSSAVVTNPTHCAVAITYKAEKTPLPVIVAKAEGTRAQRIIEIAKKASVPIMQNIPLARGLYEAAECDHYIPSDFIEPVAEVLQWVQQLKSQTPSSENSTP